MLAHLTAEQLKLLARLNNAPEGQALAALLESKLAVQNINCRTMVGPELHQAQGRAQQLADLLLDLTEAQSRLDHKILAQRSFRSVPEDRSRA